MLKKLSSLAVILLFWCNLFATHYRAGEIIYRYLSPLTYEVTVITYSKTSGTSASADRDSVEILWGDGTQTLVPRVNGAPNPTTGIPSGEMVFTDIKKNEYRWVHQYPGVRSFYIVAFADYNRIDDIININGGTSVNVPFYVEDTLFLFDAPSLGANSSPELLNPPIDFANVNDTFYHNPNAFDIDGDSLHFELIIPKQNQLSNVPIYQYPNQIIPGSNNEIFLNEKTGEFIWATPQRTGIYNIAFLIQEYRKGILLGTLIRDMQIIVNDFPNNPPEIEDVRDTCIWAGQSINLTVNAHDVDLSQLVTLTAAGGPLVLENNPAIFYDSVGNPVFSTFSWETNCSHIRSQFYQVVFKATDNFMIGSTPYPLVDLETWLIKVVAPPPENLTAYALGNAIILNWDNPYVCDTTNKFRGFSVWRKIDSNPFIPDSCETGLAGRAYTKIASGVNAFQYRDATVTPGNLYCYRIVAEFATLSPNGLVQYDFSESVPSNEACAALKKDIPVITNVSVDVTDINNGQMFVKWILPVADSINLDTLEFPPPYRIDLFRNQGFIGDNTASVIQSYPAASFSALVDTQYIDVLLNTTHNAYTYEVKFYALGDTFVGTSTPASSIYLDIGEADSKLILNWTSETPWLQDSFVVYRLNSGGIFDSITTVYSNTYEDEELINDSTYCYKIKSFGHYTLNDIPKPLINWSQENCGIPHDTVAPCVLPPTATNDCGVIALNNWLQNNFVNHLIWNKPADSCASDLQQYYLYFKAANETGYLLIDSLAANDTTYEHLLYQSPYGLAGCYKLAAVDSSGNISVPSDSFCIDNCPNYILPNVFTPNGDGANEFFVPFKPYFFVEKIDMKIYDQWGNLVFETSDPEIRWDGRNQKTGKEVSEGVYFYTGSYYEQRLNGLVEKKLPPNSDKGSSFIHLIRSK